MYLDTCIAECFNVNGGLNEFKKPVLCFAPSSSEIKSSYKHKENKTFKKRTISHISPMSENLLDR